MKLIITILAMAGALLTGACAVPPEPTPVQPAEEGAAGGEKSAKEQPPVKLTAKRIPYKRHEFASGGPYSCVKAVVVNQSQGNLEINPFFFAITGTDGEKRQAAVGAAAKEFEALTLAPGEKASGTVCAETKVAAKTLTFTDGLSEAARAEVAK